MRRRGTRIGRTAMWTGLAVCVLLLVVDVASVWWLVALTSQSQDRHVNVLGGRIDVLWTRDGAPFPAFHPDPGWYVSRVDTYVWWWPAIYTNPLQRQVEIPLWIPLVLVAIPTGLLWWRNRPPKPGHCRSCRYDLTGNVSGVCPECGEKV